MRILIIGGSGFIGSHLVDELVANGARVRIYDRATEHFRDTPHGVDFRQGYFDDVASLAEALVGIDLVFHLVSTTVPSTSNLDPIGDIKGNLINTLRLLELMRSADVSRLVYLSSGGTVYGPPETDLVTENHPRQPICSYGIVKVAIENYLYMEHKLRGLNYTVLRVSNPYGPRQGHSGVQGVIGTYLWKLANNEPIELWGDGSVVRDFIHVRDLAMLCVKAASHELNGCFNAGSGKGYSISEVLNTILKVTGIKASPVIKNGRGFDVPRVVLDISRISQAIGWRPEISLEEGIVETWNWVRQQH